MLIGRSPVRISFAGGGTDLPGYYEQFGGAVLNVAINKYFYTILGKRTDGRVQVISSDLRIFETWHDIAAMKIDGTSLEIPVAVLKQFQREISLSLFLASEYPSRYRTGILRQRMCESVENRKRILTKAIV